MIERIQQLKKEKNALIVAHYYQEPEIQDVADYVGDSFQMALYASKQKARLLVVAGVRFMGESIKVLNPDKKVIMPDLKAGCSLADSCTPEVFSYFLSKHPGAFVMTYINSSLEVKALSNVICTSSNAVKIAQQIPADQPIIFAPDQHLGAYIAKQTGRPMILFPGNCFVHTSFSSKAMLQLKEDYPDAAIVAHPECEATVLNFADFIGSTSQLLKFTQDSPKKRFIVMTEPGIIHQMQKSSPDKEFLSGPDLEGCACNVCPHMRLNTLEKIADCLEHESGEIIVRPDLAQAALKPLQKMLEMSGSPEKLTVAMPAS